MPTFPDWERQVLEECYDNVDYISLHKYFGNSSRDTLNFFGKIEETGRYIQTIGGVIDFVKAKKRSNKDVHICFDEWNVWYHRRDEDRRNWTSWDWPEAPPLLEEDYNLEDALFVGGLLNEFIRRADRVKIACIAQLVNVIAPIRTEPGGKAWTTTIYHPFRLASLHGRGRALDVAIDGPTYACEVASDVSFLDAAAVLGKDGRTLTLFILNRHLTEAMDLSVGLTGFEPLRPIEHVVIGGKGQDLRLTNSCDEPGRIKPEKGANVALEDGTTLRGQLPPLSYHVLRLTDQEA